MHDACVFPRPARLPHAVTADESEDLATSTPDDAVPSRRARLLLTTAVAATSLGVDLWTKAWAWNDLRGEPPIKVVPRFFHLEFAFNTGSAFGMLRDYGWARAFFIVVTALAVLYMIRLLLTLPRRHASVFVATGLILGGALGNLHDRIFRVMEVWGQGLRHGVVDFIVVFYWPGKRWPAFNVADAALVAGVALFMIHLHRHGERPPRPEGIPSSTGEA
jgi:signal peptidase II